MPTLLLLPFSGQLKTILAEGGLSKLFAVDWQPVTLNYVAVTKYLLK